MKTCLSSSASVRLCDSTAQSLPSITPCPSDGTLYLASVLSSPNPNYASLKYQSLPSLTSFTVISHMEIPIGIGLNRWIHELIVTKICLCFSYVIWCYFQFFSLSLCNVALCFSLFLSPNSILIAVSVFPFIVPINCSN